MLILFNILFITIIVSFVSGNIVAVYYAFQLHSGLVIVPMVLADIGILANSIALILLKIGINRRNARPSGLTAQLFKSTS